MKIGNLYVNWLTPAGKRTIAVETLDAVATHPEIRALIAKMARSEVKNYLADIAEEMEMPFTDPAGFLRAIRDMLAETSVTDVPAGSCECACANCSGCTDDSVTMHDGLSLLCRMKLGTPHYPCSGTVDDGSGGPCSCPCHAEFRGTIGARQAG